MVVSAPLYFVLLTLYAVAAAAALPQKALFLGEEIQISDPFLDALWRGGHGAALRDLRAGPSVAAAVPTGREMCVNGGVPSPNGTCECPEPRNFSGINCEQCQLNEACRAQSGVPSECDHNLAIRGTNKQFECSLNSPFFVNLMGGGRDIDVVVTLNCSSEGTNTPFAGGSEKGRCAMSLYRIEPEYEYVDAFFRCDISMCSMHMATDLTQGNSGAASSSRRGFRVLTMVGQVSILVPCVVLVLLGCFATTLGPKCMKRVVVCLGSFLVIATLLFILVMLVWMRPKESDTVATYECRKTECACAEDPPKKYKPFCSESPLNSSILPNIRNGIRYTCNLRTHRCELTLSDLALVFDLDCNASECVNTQMFPNDGSGAGTPDNTQAQRNLVVLLTSVCLLISISIVVHVVWSSSRSRRRADEFVRIFGLSEPVSHPVSPHPVEDNGGDGSENRVGGVESGGNCRRKLQRRQQVEDWVESGDEYVVPDRDCVIGLVSNSRLRRSRPLRSAGAASNDVLHHDDDDGKEFIRDLTSSPFEMRLTDLGYSLVSSRFFADDEVRARRILQKVNVTVRSGEVLAILGPSGAGKTTLLDIFSARNKSGQTTGSMSFNGTPLLNAPLGVVNQYRNIIGYVSQEDTLLPALTVHQTIDYAARLKLPQAFSNATIKRIVHQMIEALKLQRCEHTLIGDGGRVRGVSGGERRRVSIAVELLANPRILFLDEPTSGLDAVSAKHVIEAVVGLAKQSPMRAYAPHYFSFKPMIIFSIHQPSLEIFELFDKLLLLSCGVSVYCGPARDAAKILEARVTRALGSVRTVPRRTDHPNHAEYLMELEEILDDAARMELQAEDAAQLPESVVHYEGIDFFSPPMNDAPGATIHNEEEGGGGGGDAKTLVPGDDILRIVTSFRVYYANVYQQLALLTSRAWSCLISSAHLLVSHAAVTASVGVLMILLYREQSLDLPGALNRAGSITFLLLVVSFVSLSSLELLIAERKLFVVERENGFYQTLPYLLSKVLVDVLPLRIMPALMLAPLIYFSMGLRIDDGVYFFWFVVIVVLFSVCITLVVLCIGIVAGSFGAAALVSSVFILWSFVFGGFLVQSETVPAALRPFQMISPFFLAFEALLVNELDGQACTFAPTDETGKQASASIPIMCVQYLSNMGLKPVRFHGDVMQLAGFVVLLLGLAWLLLSKCTTITR